MFSEELSRFRAHSLKRIRETPLVRAVFAGDAPRAAYVRYMKDLHHCARHSPIVSALAGSRAAMTHPEVARYLIRHAGKDLGHDVWARNDLSALGVSPEEIRRARPSPPCMAMIGLEYYWAGHANPLSLLGWTFALESLGDDVGHLAAAAVVKAAAAGARGTTFLSGHREADHGRIRDLVAVVDAHVTEGRDRADVLFAAELSADLYAEMLEHAGAPGP